MSDHKDILRELETLFAERFLTRVESPTTDLLNAGMLDSLTLVQLFLYIEQRFNLTVALQDVDLDDFRSLDSIGRWIAARIVIESNTYPEADQASSALVRVGVV